MKTLRTIVYVDGFNLYYRCLKGTGHRWLDLVALCRRVLNPVNDVVALKYYTAMVDARPSDLDQPVRQSTYLRALRTRPEVSIHLGHYLTKPTRLPLARPVPGLPRDAGVEAAGRTPYPRRHCRLCKAATGRELPSSHSSVGRGRELGHPMSAAEEAAQETGR